MVGYFFISPPVLIFDCSITVNHILLLIVFSPPLSLVSVVGKISSVSVGGCRHHHHHCGQFFPFEDVSWSSRRQSYWFTATRLSSWRSGEGKQWCWWLAGWLGWWNNTIDNIWPLVSARRRDSKSMSNQLTECKCVQNLRSFSWRKKWSFVGS